jgi:peptide deformylase
VGTKTATIYKIVKYGDPVLETPAQPVAEFGTSELRDLVDSMFETMYSAKGLGLAAPQIAVSQRIAVIDPSAGEDPSARVVLINPEFLDKQGKQVGEEGCLSIPGFREDVTRAMKVRVRARSVEGESFDLDAEELLARAIQHEIDHLNGILFLSHVSMLKRDLIKRKIRKLAKANEW